MGSTFVRIEVAAVTLEEIAGMREEYRREMACQIVHDSWHARGFTTSYLFRLDDEVAGYGSVGGAPRDTRDTLKELYLFPRFRGLALPILRELVDASGARTVEAQTNDPLLLLMLLDCAAEVSSPTILFADGLTTRLDARGTVFGA